MRCNSIILVALVLFSVSCARKPERSLIGKWKGTDSTGQTASLFNDDRTFKFLVDNLVMDGPTLGAKRDWRADMSHDPMTLDPAIISPSGQ